MTNNPTIDGVSRELLERLLTDACNENWSDLNELLHSPNACRCRRFGKDNPHWPCPVHSAQGDQHDPTAAMTEAGCQAYMDADGMIGVMHNSSMGHAYIAMRALDPEVAALQSRIDQLEAEAMYAAATYQAARARIEELESGRGESVARDADRYRFLRDDATNSVRDFCIVKKFWGGTFPDRILVLDDADAEIDACLDATAALNGGKP